MSIRTAKTWFYGRKFSYAIDNKSEWRVIRAFGISQKCFENDNDVDVDVDVLNELFANINKLILTSTTYDDLLTYLF